MPPLRLPSVAPTAHYYGRCPRSSRFVRRNGTPRCRPGLQMSGNVNGGNGKARRILRVKLEDMHDGMELEGIIRSVKPYGAFVDVGDLPSNRQMLPAHRQYKGNEMVVTASEGEQVLVEVVSVDLRARKFAVREVQLSWKAPQKKTKAAGGGGSVKGPLDVAEAERVFGEVLTGDEADPLELEALHRRQAKAAQAMEKWAGRMRNRGFFAQFKPAVVATVTDFGAFVDLGGPVSEMVGRRVVSKGGQILLKPGDPVQVRIAEVEAASGRVTLTQKAADGAQGEEEAAENAAAMAVVEQRRAEEEAAGAAGGGAANSAFAKAFRRAVDQSTSDSDSA